MLISFVLILSKGNAHIATAIPEAADDNNLTAAVSYFAEKTLLIFYLHVLYVTNCDEFTAIALAIVGTDPLHKVNTPYSLTILNIASKTFLYPLFFYAGKLLSACIRTKDKSTGLAIKDPINPASIEYAVF